MFGINALTLVYTLTRHYYGRFASTDNHLYATRQLPPLFLCHHSFGRAKEYGKSFLAGQLVRASRFSSYHIYYGVIFPSGDCHVSLLYWSHVCVFLVFPAHWFCFPFSVKTPHILLLLQRGLYLKSETFKKESSCTFSTVRLLFLKTPLMVDFAFIRQEAPSISFFFTRLGVFLEFSGGHCPQVGFFFFFFFYLKIVGLSDLFWPLFTLWFVIPWFLIT